jgi:hypothetical protein
MARQISLDELEPGMVLASAVKSKHNQTLLHPNTVLAEKHKQFLRLWGVTSVYILSEGNSAGDDSAAEAENEIRAELIKRLNWQPENPFEKDLFDMAMQHETEKKSLEESSRHP